MHQSNYIDINSKQHNFYKDLCSLRQILWNFYDYSLLINFFESLLNFLNNILPIVLLLIMKINMQISSIYFVILLIYLEFFSSLLRLN